MNETLALILSSAVIAAIVSSLIGPLVVRYQERRKIRADVLSALMRVERSRWASEKYPFDAYMTDIQQLRASALIARAYRQLVEFYVQSSALARSGSDDDFESRGKNDFGGSIDGDIADFVSQTAEALSQYLWRPYTSRLTVGSKLKDLKTRRMALQRKYTGKKAPGSRIYDWERAI